MQSSALLNKVFGSEVLDYTVDEGVQISRWLRIYGRVRD